MDTKYIVAFVSSIRAVFTTMLRTEVSFGKPHVKSGASPSSGVSGIIGFTGAIRGSIVLSLPIDVATTLIERLAGVNLPPEDPDFADAIGEMVNMIAGGAKAQINQPNVAIGCPSVVIGKEHHVFQRKDAPIIVVPCICSAGNFTTEVSLINEPQAAELTHAKAV